jgi:hypothetical protein
MALGAALETPVSGEGLEEAAGVWGGTTAAFSGGKASAGASVAGGKTREAV